MLRATRGKPILIRRLFDTIAVKFGRQFYHIPSIPKKYPAVKYSYLDQFLVTKADKFELIIADRVLRHEFHLLGCEWPSNTGEGYSKINWQLDPKSGYIFDKYMLSSKCLEAIPHGVDVKYPWELSRLQHLPFLARLCISGDKKPQDICCEFENEIRDFIENNQIGYGINWACSMDVAIRAVNMLIAFDILNRYQLFDKTFKNIFAKSIYEHGQYIYRNLEKNFTEDKSGNHYLSNLCGLIIIAAYIKSSISKKWLSFAKSEFFNEVDKQFFSDGGNYEFSTSYQRLDCEILALTTAYLLAQKISIPAAISKKIYTALNFMEAIVYSNGQIVQIGDNDSGHVFRISFRSMPHGSSQEVDELDGRPAISAIRALFFQDEDSLESNFIQSITHGERLPIISSQSPTAPDAKKINAQFRHCSETRIEIDTDITGPFRIFASFGLAVLHKQTFDLFFRLPTQILQGKPFHIHCDFLHYEYEDASGRHFCDRGSYSYTGDKEKRDLFRSTAFHNVPLYSVEQHSFNGVWGVRPKAKGGLQCLTNDTIIAYMCLDNIVHRRSITVKNGILLIKDESNFPFEKGYACPTLFSPGYGILETISEGIKHVNNK
jgi:hypothetical protein